MISHIVPIRPEPNMRARLPKQEARNTRAIIVHHEASISVSTRAIIVLAIIVQHEASRVRHRSATSMAFSTHELHAHEVRANAANHMHAKSVRSKGNRALRDKVLPCAVSHDPSAAQIHTALQNLTRALARIKRRPMSESIPDSAWQKTIRACNRLHTKQQGA